MKQKIYLLLALAAVPAAAKSNRIELGRIDPSFERCHPNGTIKLLSGQILPWKIAQQVACTATPPAPQELAAARRKLANYRGHAKLKAAIESLFHACLTAQKGRQQAGVRDPLVRVDILSTHGQGATSVTILREYFYPESTSRGGGKFQTTIQSRSHKELTRVNRIDWDILEGRLRSDYGIGDICRIEFHDTNPGSRPQASDTGAETEKTSAGT